MNLPNFRPQQLLIFLFTVLLLAACEWRQSEEEKNFKSAARSLDRLLTEYEKIPVEQQTKGLTGRIWKHRKKLEEFREKTLEEWRSLDNNFLNLARSTTESRWKDDAIFCRAVMYVAWVEVGGAETLIENAIRALDDYISITSESSLEKWTKNALQDSVWDNYKKLFEPSLSEEQNVSVIFHMSVAYQLLKLKNYKRAIDRYETVLTSYPSSPLAAQAKAQIQTVNDLMQGKLAIPTFRDGTSNEPVEKGM